MFLMVSFAYVDYAACEILKTSVLYRHRVAPHCSTQSGSTLLHTERLHTAPHLKVAAIQWMKTDHVLILIVMM